jgi:septum formation inhibitor MinC
MLIFSVLVGCLIALTALLEFGSITHAQQVESQGTPANNATSDRNLDLEHQKLLLEERKVKIEEQKLSDTRFTAVLTAVAIIVPLLSGLIFIYLQGRTATKLKEVESNVAFQLQAAEIVMSSKGTKAAEERAAALRLLFPKRVPEEFVQVFDKKNFKLPGTAYQEKKLELFKTMAATAKDKKEVFQIYGMVYADEENVITEFIDKWRKAYPDDAAWAEKYIQNWKQAYPKGKWEKAAKPNV